jgi:transposase
VKGKKISRQTKRMLCMYSFHSFMLKLRYKCKQNEKKLYVVDESYTSKTCTLCGKINNVGGEEVYKCEGCGNEVDRDVNGSRNILIKNLRRL